MEAEKDAQSRAAILRAASENKIDLSEPRNAFTLWSEASAGAVFYLGSRPSLNNAMGLGREHVNIKNIVILSANPKHGLTRMADRDRVAIKRGAHPGSGL